ncbi:MAG: glycosyltransferase family 4 protein [Lachnospiraceae bacterium]|nr:glycosyltransferase family 4 protein [Lachnospiraceae bacterium]
MDSKAYMIFVPFYGDNAYIANMKKCWEHFYTVISLERAENNLYLLLNTKTVVLNWIESWLTQEHKKCLIRYKLLGIKIIWVYHNRMPHSTVAEPEQIENARKNMDFIARISDVIIIHSQNSRKYLMELIHQRKKIFYIPHIDYENQYRWLTEKTRDSDGIFRFVFQGRIAPYKNIELLIQAFETLKLPNSQLHIAGKPISEEYGNKIAKLCKNNHVFLRLGFLSDCEVGEEIQKGDVVVLPYDLKSSMNSGAMIAAFSNRRTVIISNNAMAQDYREKDFLYVYEYLDEEDHCEQLKKIMQCAYYNGIIQNKEKGRKAYKFTRINNSEAAVVEHLKEVVMSL